MLWTAGCGLPNTLQQGTMTVLTNAACANAWGSASVNNGHICIQSNTVASCNVSTSALVF